MYYYFCNVVFVLFIFFFSSRRRHTRSLRDWSSDVCSSDLAGGDRDRSDHLRPAVGVRRPREAAARRHHGRSEEHTSELQSRRDLVCRLLLEKKKKKKKKKIREVKKNKNGTEKRAHAVRREK